MDELLNFTPAIQLIYCVLLKHIVFIQNQNLNIAELEDMVGFLG